MFNNEILCIKLQGGYNVTLRRCYFILHLTGFCSKRPSAFYYYPQFSVLFLQSDGIRAAETNTNLVLYFNMMELTSEAKSFLTPAIMNIEHRTYNNTLIRYQSDIPRIISNTFSKAATTALSLARFMSFPRFHSFSSGPEKEHTCNIYNYY